MPGELVCIYATGPDMPLREMGYRLLEQDLAVDIDLTDQSSLWVDKAKGKQKTGMVGRAMLIFTDKANVEEIYARIRAVDPKCRAYALSVLSVMQ